ncbi:MAG: hypothetical protein DRJ50_04745, partial [Actinobacteria bacterium]
MIVAITTLIPRSHLLLWSASAHSRRSQNDCHHCIGCPDRWRRSRFLGDEVDRLQAGCRRVAGSSGIRRLDTTHITSRLCGQGPGQLRTSRNGCHRYGHRLLVLRRHHHHFGPARRLDRRRVTIQRGTLAQLTGAKAVANTALRWIPIFLPTLEKAFGASTTQLTTVMGAGEFAGLSTIAVGKHLDNGRERLIMVSALGLVSASALIALGGSLLTFAIAFVVLILGVANFTVAGHAWISHRVDYRWRARSIGVFETSWAFALLVGAPIIAILITVFGWRGPF